MWKIKISIVNSFYNLYFNIFTIANPLYIERIKITFILKKCILEMYYLEHYPGKKEDKFEDI